jgi:hypothetical protein
MSRFIGLFFLLTLAVGSVMAADAPPQEQVHLFLLVGQSNMAGRAKITNADRKPAEGVFLFNDKDQWEPAISPFNRYSKVQKPGFTNEKKGLNPGPSFAAAYRKANPGVSVGLVCNARGGSAIEHWKAGGKLYETSIEQTRKAMKVGVLKGICWHQGESNAGGDRPQKYPTQLKELVERFRKDLKHPTLPFVYGQIGSWEKKQKAWGPFNKMLVEQPKHIAHTACATTEGLTAFDNVHFDAKSQVRFGQRYAEKMILLLNALPKSK